MAMSGGIWGRFVYDANRVVHACEITPSYELFLVGFEAVRSPDEPQARAALDKMLCQSVTGPDDYRYVHCAVIDALPKDHRREIGVEAIPRSDSGAPNEDDYLDAVEQVVDRRRGNAWGVLPTNARREDAPRHRTPSAKT